MDQSATSVDIRDLSIFNNSYDRGRSTLICALWFATSNLFFKKWWFPARLRPLVLRAFGASVAPGIVIRQGVNIMWPWKLTIGENCWVGENAWFITLEKVLIGANVCISQGATICTGSHDMKTAQMSYKNAPVVIRDGAWVALHAVVLAGSVIEKNSVISANETYSGHLGANRIFLNGKSKTYKFN